MGKKKTPRKGSVSEQAITESGLGIFKKGDQIKTLADKQWSVYSESVEGLRHTVSFTGNIPTCECIHHTTGKERRCQAYCRSGTFDFI